MNRLLGLSLFIGFLLCHFASVADAQEKLRIIQEAEQENSPVVVVSRHVGDKAFDRSHRNRHGITAGNNWLNELSFDVKNVSHKNVIYFNIDLVVPKHGKMPGLIAFSIFFGNRMGPAILVPGDSNHNDKLVRPGKMVRVKLSDDEVSRWEKELKKYEVEDIEQVKMDIREVHFDDGTGWYLGIELRQDPLNPKIWRSLIQGRMKNHMFSSVWMSALAKSKTFIRSQKRPFSVRSKQSNICPIKETSANLCLFFATNIL